MARPGARTFGLAGHDLSSEPKRTHQDIAAAYGFNERQALLLLDSGSRRRDIDRALIVFQEELAACLATHMIMLDPRRISSLLASDVERHAHVREVHTNTAMRHAIIVTSLGTRVIRTGFLRFRLGYSLDHTDLLAAFTDQERTPYGVRTVVVLRQRRRQYVYEVGLAPFDSRAYSNPNLAPRADLDGRTAEALLAAIESSAAPQRSRVFAELDLAPKITQPLDAIDILAHRVLSGLGKDAVSSPTNPFNERTGLATATQIVATATGFLPADHVSVADRLEQLIADAIDAGLVTFDDVASLMHAQNDQYTGADAGLASFAILSLGRRAESGFFSLWKTSEDLFGDLPLELAAWFGVCLARMENAGLTTANSANTEVSAHSEMSSLRDGGVVGGWTLLRVIGRGTSGDVWEASKSFRPDRRVAVKFLEADDATRRECEILSEIHHPHLVRVLEIIGRDRNAPVGYVGIVLGLARHDLAERISNEKGLDDEGARQLGIAMASALAYLHDDAHLTAKVIVHGDIKPANILWANDRWQLADFGLATLSGPGNTDSAGGQTPEYSPPERHRFAQLPASSSADIWSLGATLAEAVTGLRPSTDGLMNPDELGADLGQLAGPVQACLALRPEDRPSATHLFRLLDAIPRPSPPAGENIVRNHLEQFLAVAQDKNSIPLGQILDLYTSSSDCEPYFERAAHDLIRLGHNSSAMTLLDAAEKLNQDAFRRPMPGVRRLMRPAVCSQLRSTLESLPI